MGRKLAAAFIGILVFVVTAASGGIQWIVDILYIIPAPTKYWAEIIGHIAWPTTIAWLVVRFRHSLRRLIEILIIRFKRDDIDIASVLKVTANSTLVPLERDGDGAATDAAITERLLEYISDSANVPIIVAWLNQNGRHELDVREFITQSEYADLRQGAYEALIKGGEHG